MHGAVDLQQKLSLSILKGGRGNKLGEVSQYTQ